MTRSKFEYRNMAEADNELVWSSQQTNTQGQQGQSSSVYAGSTYEMPSPFGSGTDANMSFSIYATYTPDDQQNVVTLLGNPFMYTGQAYENETGLYYYHARFYSPTLGRFLQTDPVGYEGGMNLYGYCRNNPLNLIDPSGCMWTYFDPCSSSFWDFLDTTGARLGLTSGLYDAMYRHWSKGHKIILFENGDDLNNVNIAWDDNDAYFMLSDCNIFTYHVNSSFWFGERDDLDYGNLSWLDWAVHLGQAALSGAGDGATMMVTHDSSLIAQYGWIGTTSSIAGYTYFAAAGGAIGGMAAGLVPTMEIASGTMYGLRHFAFGVGGTMLHAMGENGIVSSAYIEQFLEDGIYTVRSLPILCPESVLSIEGMQFGSTYPCLLSTTYAIWAGYGGLYFQALFR
jgi:RHS repeat-associated protein